tara:strand:- start:750 stop:1982 length:1233 start_codon:yes stop_codon:yes gene_type:complete
MNYDAAASQSDEVIFKKKVKKLSGYSGRGTELITVYIPPNTNRGSVMDQLTEEISQSSNIKSPSTRKNVQGALRKIINFLKQINFKIPENGLVVFAGNISETEGRTEIKLFTVRPVKELRTKRYWCDSSFHLEPLQDMLKPNNIYGLLTIDKNEATIASLVGKRYTIIGHFTSGYSGKMKAGGQSAQRFERLREEEEHTFYKRVSEKINNAFLKDEEKLRGLVIAGPGMTKQAFLDVGMIDHRLKKKIIGMVDTSYTDESGIRELVQKSEELLKDTDMMKERSIVTGFLGELAKDGLAIYGEKEVMNALDIGQVATVLVSEDIEWIVYKIKNLKTEEIEIVFDKKGDFKASTYKGKTPIEVLEENDFLDFMVEKTEETSSKLVVVSSETPEGEQFYSGFGGLGAILRYKT